MTKPDIITRANALLDELEKVQPATLHLGQLTDLADRLHHVAEMIEGYTDAALGAAGDDELNRLTDELGE